MKTKTKIDTHSLVTKNESFLTIGADGGMRNVALHMYTPLASSLQQASLMFED